MAQHNDLGKYGEALASKYLREKGYEILDENWTYEKAEIDLVVYFNRLIIFVEVKTRSSVGFGLPEDFVDQAKQQRLADAAEAYIEVMGYEGEIRFDIISILFDRKNNYTINHIEDAFWPL
ncbi:MAG: YraN family protein [Bacteroidota bacterium]